MPGLLSMRMRRFGMRGAMRTVSITGWRLTVRPRALESLWRSKRVKRVTNVLMQLTTPYARRYGNKCSRYCGSRVADRLAAIDRHESKPDRDLKRSERS